jgi:hypothetical protein
MQYRLSTLFLIFFMVAATLALCGVWGLLLATSILLAALCLNHEKNILLANVYVSIIVFIGIICTGILSHLNQIGFDKTSACIQHISMPLHEYESINKHFPSLNMGDKNGKPLFSWRIEILPLMGYDQLYKSLKKDEAWNSPFNQNILRSSNKTYWCEWVV